MRKSQIHAKELRDEIMTKEIPCHGPCPHSRGICRREFLAMATAGLLVACSPKQQAPSAPTDTPPSPTNTPMPISEPTEEETMTAYIAYCGHAGCLECPNYGSKCDGCLTEGGALVPYAVGCTVRNCNLERDIANCANCDEYSCDTLTAMFAQWRQNGYASPADQAEATLEEIHQSLSQ